MEIRLWRELLIPYELAVKDLVMKFKLLKKEHREKNLYSPIEQVTGRVKSINSILEKMQDKHVSWDELEEKIEEMQSFRFDKMSVGIRNPVFVKPQFNVIEPSLFELRKIRAEVFLRIRKNIVRRDEVEWGVITAAQQPVYHPERRRVHFHFTNSVI